MMDFVDQALGKGENVLIHCLAGAHRAGTTGVLVLMAKMKYDSRNATKVAQKLRPVINPFGPLKDLLSRVDTAIINLNGSSKLKETNRWYR
mmetsp:Transcript_21017/g.25514  ORF Transcript_21017/g.25514 Transcript_21017/m.25514 type:complete len:91 (+) Transcript_21017:96-368(+)